MKRVLMGIVWFVAFYIGSCIVIDMALGFVAGVNGQAYEADKVMAQNIVHTYLPYLFGGSLVLTIVGASTGFLPGTKKRKPT